ncbi:hypothetical protein BEL04_10895 [Mucilaginibacter sp. PPCGB 2223]|uniref:hypothetical protein n=1 Tax=Mucilaginibacter sp. PPCGB 2223 TaxID=1886027 RepID=UPI000826B522|nr:hypothetical protein [Mucilaginibacter sp. PPCGB 2223]OCX52008.1 hypothetical protein BEL04_10895 [Mucilaginibacter sp. PPCGB 2223]
MQSLLPQIQHFKDRSVSVKKAIDILSQNRILVDEEDAAIILDFLYLIAKSSINIEVKSSRNKPERNSNHYKALQT